MTIYGDTACLRELTGKLARVVFCTDAKEVGTTGYIVKETKNTFVFVPLDINSTRERTEKVLPKKSCIFEIYLKNKKSIIDGKTICFSPGQRTKRFAR